MQTIGRREKVSLPEFAINDLTAKIDTGAYTSSIHCHKVFEKESENGKELCFKLLDPAHKDYERTSYYSKSYKQKLVKSSNGKSELRYTIRTTLKIGKKTYKIEFSLTNRKTMKYPVLLGRKFIKRKFIVDVSKIFNMQSN